MYNFGGIFLIGFAGLVAAGELEVLLLIHTQNLMHFYNVNFIYSVA